MCPRDDSHLTWEFGDYYVIAPAISFFERNNDFSRDVSGKRGSVVAQGFEYNSGTNQHFLDIAGLKDYGRRSEQ
jgi:UDP-N-acetylglucosamine 4,6-dehydratase/5-epimerase